MAVGRLTLRLTVVSCPAASRAVTESVWDPAARRDKSSDWSKRPVAESNAIGVTVPASSWYVSRVIGEPVPSASPESNVAASTLPAVTGVSMLSAVRGYRA